MINIFPEITLDDIPKETKQPVMPKLDAEDENNPTMTLAKTIHLQEALANFRSLITGESSDYVREERENLISDLQSDQTLLDGMITNGQIKICDEILSGHSG